MSHQLDLEGATDAMNGGKKLDVSSRRLSRHGGRIYKRVSNWWNRFSVNSKETRNIIIGYEHYICNPPKDVRKEVTHTILH